MPDTEENLVTVMGLEGETYENANTMFKSFLAYLRIQHVGKVLMDEDALGLAESVADLAPSYFNGEYTRRKDDFTKWLLATYDFKRPDEAGA